MLYLLGQDNRILGAFPVSIGDNKDPLPDTTLKITSHVRNPDFRYEAGLLRDYDGPDVRVPPGPNNPVGVMWMELSKPHWGIHGNPEPSQMRRVTSNGCVRLTNWDALRVASVVKIGTPVEVSS
jgi:lipoprotein-anchoring transpeptidase ErfK/SrfK